MTAENGAMTPEQEQAWRSAIRGLVPAAVTALLLECSTGSPKWVRLTDLTGVDAFNSDPVFVEPDMMTVIEAAVRSFRAEPLVETDLITPDGFLVLPRPLWIEWTIGARAVR